jgi:hypothetical protein
VIGHDQKVKKIDYFLRERVRKESEVKALEAHKEKKLKAFKKQLKENTHNFLILQLNLMFQNGIKR